jgi:transcriptional pleiotropic repressor
MKNLLEKSRTLNKLMQKASGNPVEFTGMARVLGDLIDANVYITGRTGRLLGFSFMDDFICPVIQKNFEESGNISEMHNETLLRVPQTMVNMKSEKNICVLQSPEMDAQCPYTGKVTTIVPIVVSGHRQGTLVLTKFNNNEFNYEDTILAEYGAMVIGMEILRARSERIEEEARQKAAVQIAIGTLSYSEQEAIEHIFEELNGKEALLVASKIADRVGITRSVIVNALRKFESAGVIETKSLGMKGTYIRVLNDNLLEELEKRKAK